ncbi:hypothetical protein AQUCO_07500022v1 [Aquilegia coerulea]|uniref:BZIP domain-containing protein n=1 Tax=Aquilegia coerulea TaxID=218851 RepID=A0A2G5CAB7_AQUCA|nr:hypothetical protein AQUCO_07500022v1 [Aquilegia coerulea]
MWSSRGEEIFNNTRTNNRRRSSTSSSSSYQSQSPFLATPPFQIPSSRKAMEEVWKDINPSSSLQQQSTREEQGTVPLPPSTNTCHHHPHHKTSLRGINLQEFLARPFSREPPSSLGYCTTSSIDQFGHFGSAPQPPPTYLCLNTDPSQLPLVNHSNDAASSFVESLNNPFDAFASSSEFSPFGKKRGSESEDNTGDTRHKRMIKNRESAAPYIFNKVDHLSKENERILRQQQELIKAVAAAQQAKKRTLQRTSTAPF